MVGAVARRPWSRAVRRGLAVGGVLSGALFGAGSISASAQTGPCILIVCTPPLPVPVPPLPVPTPTPTPLPTLTSLPVPPLPVPAPVPPPLSTPTPLPVLPPPPIGLPGTGTPGPVTVPTPPTPPILPTPTAPATTGGTPGPPGVGVGSGGNGQTCTVNVLGICVNPSSPPSPNASCLNGSSDPTCVIQNTGSPTGKPSGGGGGGTNSGGGTSLGSNSGAPGSSASPTAALSAFGGGGFGTGTTQGGGTAIPLGLSVASIPPLEQLGPVSGLHFGHALILWPLFGLLDVLGLAAVYLVVRRVRASRQD
jgi:hypothetical protein